MTKGLVILVLTAAFLVSGLAVGAVAAQVPVSITVPPREAQPAVVLPRTGLETMKLLALALVLIAIGSLLHTVEREHRQQGGSGDEEPIP